MVKSNLNSFSHEIFVSEDAYLFLVSEGKYDKSYSDLVSFLDKKCSVISKYLSLRHGMSVMLVKRDNNVYFVYNQCLDTSLKNVPNNSYINNCTSLGRDRNVFKPKRNVKVFLNSYVSWYRLVSEDVTSLVEKNYMFCKWK